MKYQYIKLHQILVYKVGSQWLTGDQNLISLLLSLACFIVFAKSQNYISEILHSCSMPYEHSTAVVWVTILARLCLIDLIFYVLNEQLIQGWAKGLITLNTIKQHFKILLTSSV